MAIGTNNILSIAQQMAAHASERQVVLAENIAHADTPGYRAKDITSFQDIFARGEVSTVTIDHSQAVKPNGNSVSLEQQVMNLAETKGQHDMSMALWQQTMGMYRIAMGRG